MGMASMNGILTNREFKNNWWEIIPMLIGIVVLFTTVSCQLTSMYPISSDQFEYVLELFPFALSGVVSTIKLIRLFTYRSRFYHFLQQIKIIWESGRLKNILTSSILKRAERTRLMTSYYTSLIAFVCITHLIYPYIFVFKHQFGPESNSSYDFSATVFPCIYPIKIDSYPKYFMLITFEQIDVTIACTAWASCDTLFAQLSTHVSLQFMEIINNCGNLGNNPESIEKLRDIVNRYQQLFLFCESIESFFSPVIFATVISNAINLCCGMYRLDQEINAGNWNGVTTQAVYITSVSLQTVVFCIFSETLTESSTIMGEAIYHSQWTDCDQNMKIKLLLIMVRSRKQFICTAYNIIDVNYNQLKQIANAAVSYFMLLRSL
ncbi:hypothetical protein PV326_009660 [Microctonus aethiopoides]|nr:hypothetical protein PV326_009660 [Microctonus aethiopoides]